MIYQLPLWQPIGRFFYEGEEKPSPSITEKLKARPSTREETIEYNKVVKSEFDRVFRDGERYSKFYTCFDSDKQKQRLQSDLAKAFEPKTLLLYVIKEIERHFNYTDCLGDEYSSNQQTASVTQQSEIASFKLDLFPKMVIGAPIDLDAFELSEHILLHYTHVLEISIFYRYLKNLEQIMNGHLQPGGNEPIRQGNFQMQNNFDQIRMDDVYNHFKAGLVDKNYLSESDLKQYLEQAFNKKTKPTKLFRFSDIQTKSKIQSVFYKYYKDIAGKPHGKQVNYAALLGDYFEGYNTSSVSTNFNK
ncbi:hypothetical protein BH10BAC3_BH10BAC3_16190 [soil metagenome]